MSPTFLWDTVYESAVIFVTVITSAFMQCVALDNISINICFVVYYKGWISNFYFIKEFSRREIKNRAIETPIKSRCMEDKDIYNKINYYHCQVSLQMIFKSKQMISRYNIYNDKGCAFVWSTFDMCTPRFR